MAVTDQQTGLGIPPTPEASVQPPTQVIQEQTEHHGSWLRYAAVGTVAAIVAGSGVVAVTNVLGETETTSPPTSSDNPTGAAEANPSATQETTPTWAGELADPSIGNVQVAVLREGEPSITATLLSGESVEVPYLRNLSEGSDAVMSSFMALFACGNSSESGGAMECLTALSSSNDVMDKVLREAEAISSGNDSSGSELEISASHQVSIFDTPDDPAIFKTSDLGGNSTGISLESGKVYLNVYSDGDQAVDWQGSETHSVTGDAVYVLEEFWAEFATDDTGNTLLMDIDWHWVKL